MPVDLNAPEVKTWLAFLRAHAFLMREMNDAMQERHGMPLMWMDVLVQLSLAEDKRMTHTRLSQRVLVSQSGLTRVIDKMTRAGLVVRRASRSDRRTSYVVMTPKGEATLKTVYETQVASVMEMFVGKLRPGDIPVIRNFLARVMNEREPEGVREEEER